ncbi:hypothetical protein [Streptomyces hydrogenans]|uniref:hypothetical protein n=1 Tax=Streptomyces hydrogenans TaxID=1873719 RepID=UPI003D73739A
MVTADFARYQEFIGRALESDTRTGGKPDAIENYRTADEAYAVYQRDDRIVRSLVAAGRERQAVAFGISWEPGKSNAPYGAWMKALDEVTAINSRAFDAASDDGRNELNGHLPWAVVGLLAAAVLAALGPRPRLAEFR